MVKDCPGRPENCRPQAGEDATGSMRRSARTPHTDVPCEYNDQRYTVGRAHIRDETIKALGAHGTLHRHHLFEALKLVWSSLSWSARQGQNDSTVVLMQ